MGTSRGPAFSGSCCRSLGTDLLVLTAMPTQWGQQVLDLQTHRAVPGPAVLMFSCVKFSCLSENWLSIKITVSDNGESVSGQCVWLEVNKGFLLLWHRDLSPHASGGKHCG